MADSVAGLNERLACHLAANNDFELVSNHKCSFFVGKKKREREKKSAFLNLPSMPSSLPYRFDFKQPIAKPTIHFKNPYFSPEHHLIIPVIKPATPKVPPFALQWNLT